MPLASSNDIPCLWDFSLACYAHAGVADACLRLQDEQGANVNLLLWSVWLEQRGLVLDAARLHSAQARIQRWDEYYVLPLRQLRRRMKTEFGVADAGIELVRTHIKQAELLAEKQLLLWLESLAQPWDDSGITRRDIPAANDNVRFYLQQLNVSESAIAHLLEMLGKGTADSMAQERI